VTQKTHAGSRRRNSGAGKTGAHQSGALKRAQGPQTLTPPSKHDLSTAAGAQGRFGCPTSSLALRRGPGQGGAGWQEGPHPPYGFTRTAELDGGRALSYPTSKEVWHKRVRGAVADAAARFLQAKAVERKLPGPAVVAKRNNLLKFTYWKALTSPSTGSRSGRVQSQAASASGTRGTVVPALTAACPATLETRATCSSVTRLLRLYWRRGPLCSVALLGGRGGYGLQRGEEPPTPPRGPPPVPVPPCCSLVNRCSGHRR
jgi:hypothetical protein